jgi:hypothetical protein
MRWRGNKNGSRLRLVAQNAIEADLGEALLPAPDEVFDLAVRRMISFVPSPSAVNKTISARQTCFCGVWQFATNA